ncbi:MAG: ATP-binding cassette domain-containing protein [Aquaticitalea sp.]
MILEVDNVELYFSKKRILNGVYLKAETGKVTSVLGSNGCGKTSLLSIIFGSLQPKYKLIRLNGKPILKPLYTTNIVSYLPQHELSPNNLKIKTLFKFLNVDWFEFSSRFENFSFFWDSKINNLSGGERRVLETYLILKSDKQIVLLDEPFSHIAPLYIEKLKNLIQVEKQTKAIILTDHYFKDVMEATDDLYLLKNGCTQRIESVEALEDYNYLNTGMAF